MSHPKLGMFYEDVRKRVKGSLGRDGHMRESLLNQARLHEGEKAKAEIERELSMINKSSQSFSGAGSSQVGIGNGNKQGDGRYKYKDGRWERV